MAYDEKYRMQAVAFKDAGHSFDKWQEVFGVYNATYYRVGKNLKKLQELTHLNPPKIIEKKESRHGKTQSDLERKIRCELAETFPCSTAVIYILCLLNFSKILMSGGLSGTSPLIKSAIRRRTFSSLEKSWKTIEKTSWMSRNSGYL